MHIDSVDKYMAENLRLSSNFHSYLSVPQSPPQSRSYRITAACLVFTCCLLRIRVTYRGFRRWPPSRDV